MEKKEKGEKERGKERRRGRGKGKKGRGRGKKKGKRGGGGKGKRKEDHSSLGEKGVPRGDWPTKPLALGLLQGCRMKSQGKQEQESQHTHSPWLAQTRSLEMSPLSPQQLLNEGTWLIIQGSPRVN